MFGIFKKKHPKVDYTHWDIHALARILAPSSWAAFDAAPKINPKTGRSGRSRHYWDHHVSAEYQAGVRFNCTLHASFLMAINALKAGYKAPWGHLRSDEELADHVSKQKALNK